MKRCKHLNAVIVEYSKVGSTLDVRNGKPENTMYHSNADPTGYSITCVGCKYRKVVTTPDRFPKWARNYWETFINYSEFLGGGYE